MKGKMLESLATYQRLGSGWRLHSMEMLEIFITRFKPLNGKSYKPFPKVITKKKAVINMENNDDQCFKRAISRALNPVDRDSERVTKILKTQAEKYNWGGIGFPTKLKDIHKFENNNGVNVNVFSFDDDTKKVYTLRLSKTNYKETVTLFLYDEYYGVVKNLSRLVSGQLNKQGHKKHICTRCLNHFKTLESLERHLELCQNHDHQHHVCPNEFNNYTFFKQCIGSPSLYTPTSSASSNPPITKLVIRPSNTKNIHRAGSVIQSNVWTSPSTKTGPYYTRQRKKVRI